jgi:hypothetical protein
MNTVRAVRVAKGLQKKQVLDLCKGILTPHRLNSLEGNMGWRPKKAEMIALATALGVAPHILFPDEQLNFGYIPQKPKVHFDHVGE